VGKGPEGIVAGDFNGDGILDLAVANDTDVGETISILLARAMEHFKPRRSTPRAGFPRSWPPATSTATADSTWSTPTCQQLNLCPAASSTGRGSAVGAG